MCQYSHGIWETTSLARCRAPAVHFYSASCIPLVDSRRLASPRNVAVSLIETLPASRRNTSHLFPRRTVSLPGSYTAPIRIGSNPRDITNVFAGIRHGNGIDSSPSGYTHPLRRTLQTGYRVTSCIFPVYNILNRFCCQRIIVNGIKEDRGNVAHIKRTLKKNFDKNFFE